MSQKNDDIFKTFDQIKVSRGTVANWTLSCLHAASIALRFQWLYVKMLIKSGIFYGISLITFLSGKNSSATNNFVKTNF